MRLCSFTGRLRKYIHVASPAQYRCHFNMADSDEEHDRSRSRDKFRRERSDYGDKPRSRADRRTWRDDHETVDYYVCLRVR